MGQDEEGSVYLVLELMTGEPLTAQVARGPMSAQDALARLLPVIDALAMAHSHGIVHRDLKPDNIFLSLDGQGREVPKLLDFGIAKVAGGNTAKTGTGFIVGTPSYMSPEQALGKSDLGPASDVWSMGVVLFECLTGKLPFTAESPTGLLVNIVTQRAPGVGTMGVEVPASIAQVIDRALLTDPLVRFRHAGELAQALHAAAGQAGLTSLVRASTPRAQDATGPRPVSALVGTGPITPPAAATPFTWAAGDAKAVEAPPKKRLLPLLLAGGVGVVAVVVIGVVVAVSSGGKTTQSTAAQPLIEAPPPVVPPLVALPLPPPPAPIAAPVQPPIAAPVQPPMPGPVAALPIAVLPPDAGLRRETTARVPRTNPARGKAPPPVVAQLPVARPPAPFARPIAPVAPPPPVPRDPPAPPRPQRERGANGSLILD